jgi:hypothetical protein
MTTKFPRSESFILACLEQIVEITASVPTVPAATATQRITARDRPTDHRAVEGHCPSFKPRKSDLIKTCDKSKAVPLLGQLSPAPWRRMGEWKYISIILDLGTRWRWVVRFIPRPLYRWGKSSRWAPEQVCAVRISPVPWGNGSPAVQPRAHHCTGSQRDMATHCCVLVCTIDGVWIGNWIDWKLTDCTYK